MRSHIFMVMTMVIVLLFSTTIVSLFKIKALVAEKELLVEQVADAKDIIERFNEVVDENENAKSLQDSVNELDRNDLIQRMCESGSLPDEQCE